MQKPDKVFRVLFVGMVSLQKGVPYLLEAMHRLNLPNAELLLVGRVAEGVKAALNKYVNTAKLVGTVPQQELFRYYGASSVFVLPSIQDGFGMVVYEAMACGLPTIITENVGAPVRAGIDGFVVPIRDAGALAEKILFFYENEEARRTMGAAAREYVQQFTWERYGEQVVAAYRRILDSVRER